MAEDKKEIPEDEEQPADQAEEAEESEEPAEEGESAETDGAADEEAEEGEGRTLVHRATGPISKQGGTLTTGALERMLLAEFPAADAEPWDRTGMTVGDPARPVTGVAVALDPTVEAIREAAHFGANVLVTHHPAYREAPDSFRPGDSVAENPGAGVWCAIEEGVSLMSFHTALDVSARAQRVLPSMLSLVFERVLVPLEEAPEKGYGQLCSCALGDSLKLGQLAARCMSVFGRPPRVWGDFSRKLDRVVTCTGSAGDVAKAALAAHADCLVCGEIKYHDALDLSQAGLAIVELGHDVSELPLAVELADVVRDMGVPDECVTLIDQGENWSYPETVRM